MFGLYEIKERTRLLLGALSIVMAWAIVACVSANPLARAETVEQKAYAAYGTFVIFEEQAASLVTSGTVGDNVARVLIAADETAKPVADGLLDATLEFGRVKAEFEAGATSEERFLIAMKSLNDWTERALPLINNLVKSVRGAE